MLQVELEWSESELTYTFRNNSKKPVEFEDAGYLKIGSFQVPYGINVRLSDAFGEVILNQNNDPAGWWTPHYYSSRLITGDPDQVTLKSGEQLTGTFPVYDFMMGFEANIPQPEPAMCKIQARAIVAVTTPRRRIVEVSEWGNLDCARLSSIHWKDTQ